MAKGLLNKKAFTAGPLAAGTLAAAAPALQILQAKRRKLIYLLLSTIRLQATFCLHITIFAI